MAEADLGPDELDRLEDALEELELDGALARWSEEELGPRVHARLLDYRTVLAATREAMPLEDVPAGVLDGVLAQARQAAAVAPAAVIAVGHESWWTRLRRGFMVPALALAGTAVLVLWVFDPKDQAKLTDPPPPPAPTPAAAEAAPGEKLEEGAARQAAVPAATPVRAEEERALADEAEGAIAEPEATVTKNEAPAKPVEVDAGATGRASSVGDAGGAVPGSLGGVPSAAEQQKKSGGSAGPASGRWDIVSRGDRARQAGDCVAARDEYALALEDDEPRVRARAFAGLGLCDAAAGDEASADANYERARALDGEIESFIESQRERSRGAEKKARKPAPKKSKVAVDAFDGALE